MEKEKIEQEIEWIQEEIDQDEMVRGTSDFNSFFEQRISENRQKLKELKDLL